MKKLIAILLTSILFLSVSVNVLADGTTVLTTSVPAATYTQDPATGAVIINPGVSVLTVTGTV